MATSISLRICKECGGKFPHSFFHRSNSRFTNTRICKCIGCQQTGRDQKKYDNRFRVKAYNAIRSHSRRFKIEMSEMESLGWTTEKLEHRFRHASKNGCEYCHKPFGEMMVTHGLGCLTIDIFDRSLPLQFETNTRICCPTCNKEKGAMTPKEWMERVSCWQRWSKTQDDLEAERITGLPLMDMCRPRGE